MNIKQILGFIASAILFIEFSSACSIITKPKWSKTFGGEENDMATSLQQTKDGGYIIVGFTKSYGAGGGDVWLIKTDAEGNKLWDKAFGGEENDVAWSVEQTKDGGYIIAGATESYGAGGYNIWLIKTDADGNKLWDKTFGCGSSRYYHNASVQQTKDGGYIIAGCTKCHDVGGYDICLIKTDADGNKLWGKVFLGLEDDFAGFVQQTKDGGYIVAGGTETYGARDCDIWLIKTDAEGGGFLGVWNKTFGGEKNDMAWSVQQTKDGGYIIAGYTFSYGAGGGDVWLIKTDAEGNKLWGKAFGGEEYDEAASVQQTKDGGYIIAGCTLSYGAGGGDIWLIKTDAEGNKLWDKTFGGEEDDVAMSVQQTKDGGYIIAGYTDSYGAGGGDVWLIKTDAEGNTIQ